MKITKRWLKKNKACEDGKAWVLAQDTDDAETLIKRLLGENNLVWANWLLPRCLKRINHLKYGVYLAESVIGIFEKNYPDDNRPRLAIDAVKKVLGKNTRETRLEALAAARLAEDAAAYSAAWSSCSPEEKARFRRTAEYGLTLLHDQEL